MPTIKQEKALEKMVENGGKASQAMREVGYSFNTAKTPQKLTNSKGWDELLDKFFPDELLAFTHKEGLRAVKKDGEYDYVADYAIRFKYLELMYKLKDKYPPQKTFIVQAKLEDFLI